MRSFLRNALRRRHRSSIGWWLAFAVVVSQPGLARPVSAQSVPPPSASGAASAEQDLGAALIDAATTVANALGEVQSSGLSLATRRAFEGRLDRIRADDLLIRARHADLQRLLVERQVGGLAPARLAEAAAAYRDQFASLGAAIDETARALGANDLLRLRTALDALGRELEARASAPDRAPIGVSLPFRSLSLPPVEPAARPAIVPAYAAAQFRNPVADDLSEAPEAQLDAAIVEQARALGQNPIALFELVQNDIDLEFYQGSMKGAGETLRQRRGNDVDQASLLVALMRASQIPARYVRGVIVLTTPQALAWTGVSGARRAADVLAAAGIPFRTTVQGGSIAQFEIEHTWVEVAVPYSNYRGAPISNSGRLWIPLDPSMKAAIYSAGTDVLDAMGFDAGATVSDYLSALQTLSPLDFIKQRITSFLQGNRPDLTYAQTIGHRTLQRGALGLLPNTLPYWVASVSEESVRVAESLRHRIRFTTRIDGETAFDVTMAASDVIGKRVTLSYMPDTVEDQNTIDAFLGLDSTPAYLVRLRPVLKVGGVVQAAGERALPMGAMHDFAIEIQGPRATVPIENALMAGGYYAVAFGGTRVVHEAAATPAEDDTEEGAADILYGLAADYLERWNRSEQELADVLRLSVIRPIASEVMVGTVHRRTVLFGQPQEMVWRGVFVDADLRVSEVVPVVSDTHQSRRIAFRQLSGLVGSMAESEVLEATLQVDSVSGAKAIQLARASAVPILEIDSSNEAVVRPTLNTAEIVRTEIADGVRQGWRATVPQHDIIHRAWTGIGYVLTDPTDGAAGYFLSGGLAGGSTAQNPEDWVRSLYTDRLGHPYAPKANADPAAAATIVIIPISDGQTGVVGQQLPKPLAVLVRDGANKPVKGATVTFRILVGGGAFGSSDSVTTQTDALGIARATPTLGTTTGTAPFYVLDHPGDRHVTQVGQNLISASVPTHDGPAELPSPFQALAHPDAPLRITKLLGDNSVALAGTKGSSMLARVDDRHGNPVSNVSLVFSVLPAHAQAGVLPTFARNLKLLPPDPPCPNPAPVLGECNGRDDLVVLTSIFGASVDPILGDTENTIYEVSATVTDAPTVPVETFFAFSAGSRQFNTNTYQRSKLVMTRRELVNDKGSLLNATKVGTQFVRPLETVLYLVEDNYVLDRVNSTCPAGPPAPPCYRINSIETTRTRPVNSGQAGAVTFATTVPDAVSANTSAEVANVAFIPTQGGGSTDPVAATGHGGYSTRLTVGGAPMLNIVDTLATATVWTPYQDLYTGTVTPVLVNLRAGQLVTGFNPALPNPLGGGPLPIVGGAIQSLNHEVFGVRLTLTPPAQFPMGADSLLTADAPIAYKIEPADYRALQADLDIFEVDTSVVADAAGCQCKWIGLSVGNNKQGDGVSPLFRGTTFDRFKSYRLQMVLNRGSEAAVLSDKKNLVFLTGVATYTYYKALPPNGIPAGRPGHFAGGLDYDNPDPRSVRGAQVSLIDGAGNLVGLTNTDESGFYSFAPPAGAGNFRIRIAAALGGLLPHLIVADNTNANPATNGYATVCTLAWNPATSANVDAFMDSGWNKSTKLYGPSGTSCTGDPGTTRASAPFAILDTIYQAEKTMKTVDPAIDFPLAFVYWSAKNTTATPINYPSGAIDITHYSPTEGNLYILGQDGVDTDEYDSHVLLHEWGHYFQHRFSRSDPMGGSHPQKKILDPRLSFGEGFGNAFSGMLFDPPDPVYVDTNGVAQASSFKIDVSADSVPDNEVVTDSMSPSPCIAFGANPFPAACSWKVDGYYAQASVQEVLWDLSQSLGVRTIYRTLREMRTTEGFTTIFSFLHHLRRLAPNEIEFIDTIARGENIPIGDEYGEPGVHLYTNALVMDASAAEVLLQVGLTTVFDGNGRVLQTWAGRVAGGSPDPDPFSPDRWDVTTPPAQPQTFLDDALPSPCAYTDSTGNLQTCFSVNRLFDRVFLRFTIQEAGDYAIEVAPTSGAPFGGGDLAFVLYSGAEKTRGTMIDDPASRTATEVLVTNLQRGTHLLEVMSWRTSARFTVRIHQ